MTVQLYSKRVGVDELRRNKVKEKRKELISNKRTEPTGTALVTRAADRDGPAPVPRRHRGGVSAPGCPVRSASGTVLVEALVRVPGAARAPGARPSP